MEDRFITLRTSLTDRQVDCIQGVVDGLTNRQVAERLGIPQPTVVNEIAVSRMLLGATNRTHLAMIAINRGWRESDDEG